MELSFFTHLSQRERNVGPFFKKNNLCNESEDRKFPVQTDIW